MNLSFVVLQYAWYFPGKDRKNAPSLSKSYAYYEHITLPRHFVGEQNADHVKRRSEPGEIQETELYSPWTTRSSNFIEWGIGVDLYFSTLRIMAAVLFLAGIIHLPNLVFYRSTDYSPAGKGPSSDLSWSLYGSAVCTTTEWVACEDCTVAEWATDAEKARIGTAANGRTVVQRLACEGGGLQQGVVNWVVLFMLTGVLFFLSIYLGAREVRFDEDKTTATDYTIVIKNPPPDAYDPHEWRDFFAQFSEKQYVHFAFAFAARVLTFLRVTAVTIGLNNERMLNLLIARRTHRNNLRLLLPKGVDMEDEDGVRTAVAQLVHDRESEPRGCLWAIFACTALPILRLFNIMLPPEDMVDRVFRLTEEIKELQKQKYDVSRVFITFETEEGQRNALQALSIGRFNIMMNHTSGIAPSIVFKDRLLYAEEPAEPSAIRWLSLSASGTHKLVMRLLNLAITVGVIALAGLLVSVVRFRIGAWAAAPLISVFNTIIPLIVKILMIFEPHGTEGSFQTALYLKITLFRCVSYG